MARRDRAPRWLKLDNAANIYPPSRSRNWAAMFRVSVTLTEAVDPAVLEKAQAAALKRMPSFSYRLRRGVFWYYFERMTGAPRIQEDVANPMVPMTLSQNDHFLFRVRYYGRRIALEIFHALTDGTGALTFLLTMAAEYLRLKNGAKIAPGGHVLDMRAAPTEAEREDSFLIHSRNAYASRMEKAAYHVHGTPAKLHHLNITTGLMPVDAVKKVAKAYGASVTELLTSVLIMSIAAIQKGEPSARARRRPVKITVPVNLRPYYRSVTLRNFASYVNVGINSALGEYSLAEVIAQVRHQLGAEVTEKGLNARFSANVMNVQMGVVRGMPLFLKAPFLKLMFTLQGDRYCSSTLSNLGAVQLPEGMRPYVDRLDFLLGAPSGNPVVSAAISYNGTLSINFSRIITERAIERGFFTRLVKLGIPVKIESNQR